MCLPPLLGRAGLQAALFEGRAKTKRSCSISIISFWQGGAHRPAIWPAVWTLPVQAICVPPWQAVISVSPLPPGLPAPMQDDYIDDTMDAENYESSFDEWGESMPGTCCI